MELSTRAEKWSLTERPGWLRLHAFELLVADNLLKAGNTLTKRTLRTATNTIGVKLDLSGMADGQKAGWCHFARSHSALGVTQVGAVRQLEFRLNGGLTLGPVLTNNLLWVKSTWELAGRSHFAYSLNDVVFTTFGEADKFDWGHYHGNRVGSTALTTRPQRAMWMWTGFTTITSGRAGGNAERIYL